MRDSCDTPVFRVRPEHLRAGAGAKTSSKACNVDAFTRAAFLMLQRALRMRKKYGDTPEAKSRRVPTTKPEGGGDSSGRLSGRSALICRS